MTHGTYADADESEVVAVLSRTTPADLAEVDVGRLARRHRQRRRRRRALLAGATAVVLVTGVTAGTLSWGSSDDPDGSPEVETDVAGPGGQVLTEPVGVWRQAADPPFEARTDAFAGTLSDGRMFVWGGDDAGGDDNTERTGEVAGFADGGIYDPETDTWEAIPAAPIPSAVGGGAAIVSTAGDRLVVVAGAAGGRVDVAVYDVAAGEWLDAPPVEGITEWYDAIGWDGQTLVLVQTQGTDEPVTVRWQVGEDRWTTGASFPLGARNLVGAASDGTRIAVWGGSEGESVEDGEPEGAYADGAIYDIAADTWTRMADGPLRAGTNAAMWWWQGRLLVGSVEAKDGSIEVRPEVAAYDPDTETWETLPPAPEGGAWVWRSHGSGGNEPVVTAETVDDSGQVEPEWFFTAGHWEQAPLPGVRRIGDFVVADTDTMGNAGDIPYGLRVRAAPDQWLEAAEAPFLNRMNATKVTNEDTMLVVGGLEGATIELKDDAWVFDIAG